MTLPHRTFEDLHAWQQRARASASRLDGAAAELIDVFASTARHAQSVASKVDEAVSRTELQARPVSHVADLLAQLDARGPDSLTIREQKTIIGAPAAVRADQLDRLVARSPALARHAGRICLTHWHAYLHEPWGVNYRDVVARRLPAGVQLFETKLPIYNLLARKPPTGDELIAAELPTSGVEDAYVYMKEQLRVRDTWTFASSVMSSWLDARVQLGSFMDEHFAGILRNPRLRALLLPALRSSSSSLPVRTSLNVQAKVVTAALQSAFARPPRLKKGSTLGAILDHLLKSTFDDPRSALRSEGWIEVERLDAPSYRRLLASLCEQDLEVFFQHAMNEPDRQAFWLRYLPEIERTGCVLDRSIRARLSAKLQGTPELQTALERAHGFKNASDVQAFFLVFPAFVVVEFSDSGNAAYVYKRDLFTKKIEPAIRRGAVENERGLKLRGQEMHRITHQSRWQAATAEWLAENGVHRRA